jgi:hypothetical protein
LLFFTCPELWPNWPVLPLVRRREGQSEELGLLVDAMGLADRPGYSATVFLGNLFLMPSTLEELLALPHETFDTADEIHDAGWCVD